MTSPDKMEICRACLLSEQDMVALDEFCVNSYNLLTSLQINLGDEMPQFFCQNCFNMVKVFTDFREKAIMSETSLREITENTEHGDLFKEDTYTCGNNIKTEIYLSDDGRTDYEALDVAAYCAEAYDSESGENNLDVKYQLLQCGLCKGEFLDNTAFLNHLKQHKKGGKCKLCFEKVKIVDLYAHTLAHLQSIVNMEHDSESKPQVKLELSDVDYYATSGAIKVEKKERKSATKFKKRSKLPAKSSAQPLLACGLCEMMFDCKDLLVKHLDSHKVEGNSSCEICTEDFSSWPQLFGHRIAHVPQNQRHCHLCKFWNNSQNAMEFHYRKLHYDGEDKLLQCKQCFRSFATPRKLSRHMPYAHGPKRYVCDYCSKRHHSKQSLRYHIASHLQARPFVCDVCGFSSKLKAGLTAHKMRKHDPRKMICKLCHVVFVDKAKFDQHNCNPTSVVCPECGKEFLTRKMLNSHMRSHRSERPYLCSRCPASYRSRAALRVHVDRHDGTRSRRCEHCGACFYSLSVLIKHRRVHTGEKPYVCKICHRGFTGNHNLKVHMRIHGEDLIVKKDKSLQKPNPFVQSN